MAVERRLIEMPDGRVVDVLLAGPDDGLPLVLHNGTPSGLVALPATVQDARIRGLRTIMVARPGYEGSTPRPGRLVADVTGDVAAVLDALGADTFLTAGWSGGGPHALACSVLLSGRCLAAATIAGVAPYQAEGLDWMAGMGPENVREFGASLRGGETLDSLLEAEAASLGVVQGDQVIAELGGLLPEADKAVLTGPFADYMAASLRASVQGEAGIAGWRDDDLAFVADWGFPLASAGKVAVWQGNQDLMVPQAHGKWLAKHIPGARSRFKRGEGHLSLKVTTFGAILDDLLDMAGL
ncbi:MAG TPA: alpha/beta hydrolase [Streptosporangiaceae bacterium]